MSKSRIYLDYASLTPIDPAVIKEVGKFSVIEYANPSSWYKEGVIAKNALDDGRKRVAGFLSAHPDEIVFTSGGTESNNLAIIGAVESLHTRGVDYEMMHVIVSVIEHSSIRECANYLNGKGVAIDVISVGKDGVVQLGELKSKITPKTVIVSVMMVNNEIGTIQPIKEIAKIVRDAKKTKSESKNSKQVGETNDVASQDPFAFQDFNYPIFHTDASQAVQFEELNVDKLGVDLLTLDGAKIYGPRGVGALYIRRSTPITSTVHGGGQEFGLRSGTENIPSIMGFAKAMDIAMANRAKETERIVILKEYFFTELKKIRADIKANPDTGGAPHILNVSIPKIDGEFFVMQLDARGVACSTKSSCLRDEDESYVLKSIGADSRRSIRFSLGRWTEKGDVKKAAEAVADILND